MLEAALAGLVAGLLVPFALAAAYGETVGIGTTEVIGSPGLTMFWVAHVGFSTLFGALFGLLVDSRPLWRYARGFLGPVVGVVFGALLWAVDSALLWPAWFQGVGLPIAPSIPLLDVTAFVTYLAYGALVGTLVNLFA